MSAGISMRDRQRVTRSAVTRAELVSPLADANRAA